MLGDCMDELDDGGCYWGWCHSTTSDYSIGLEMQAFMTAACVWTQVETIQCTGCIGVCAVRLVMGEHIGAAGRLAMVLVGDILLMNNHPRAKVFGNTLPGGKNIWFPCTLVRQVFHDYTYSVHTW